MEVQDAFFAPRQFRPHHVDMNTSPKKFPALPLAALALLLGLPAVAQHSASTTTDSASSLVSGTSLNSHASGRRVVWLF